VEPPEVDPPLVEPLVLPPPVDPDVDPLVDPEVVPPEVEPPLVEPEVVVPPPSSFFPPHPTNPEETTRKNINERKKNLTGISTSLQKRSPEYNGFPFTFANPFIFSKSRNRDELRKTDPKNFSSIPFLCGTTP
jgi:hypothetical protein